MTFLILLVSLTFGLFAMKRNKETLYVEKVKEGKILLNFFANNAGVSLLGDDILSLNTLIKETKNTDGFLYAMIVDNRNIIKAHTDPSKVGVAFKEFEHAEPASQMEDTAQVAYLLPSGAQVLNLSRAIMYADKIIGSVHLGLSVDSVNKVIKQTTLPLVREVIFLTLLMLVLALGASFFIHLRFNRPLSKLILARQEGREGEPLHEELPMQEISDRPTEPQKTEEEPSAITRNQVTVLFAGIKGFKAYANAKAPEEVLKDLNEYLSIAGKYISEYGGYLDKFVGDAVIGVFGNLPLQTDHSERAVRSAMAMQRAFQKASQNGNQLLSLVGIGISSGVVLSGPIGTRASEGIAFIGESFKVAYLLNVMAGPGEVVLSKDVYQLIEPFVSAEPLPPRELMQRTESWENFRLQDILDRKDYG